MKEERSEVKQNMKCSKMTLKEHPSAILMFEEHIYNSVPIAAFTNIITEI